MIVYADFQGNWVLRAAASITPDRIIGDHTDAARFIHVMYKLRMTARGFTGKHPLATAYTALCGPCSKMGTAFRWNPNAFFRIGLTEHFCQRVNTGKCSCVFIRETGGRMQHLLSSDDAILFDVITPTARFQHVDLRINHSFMVPKRWHQGFALGRISAVLRGFTGPARVIERYLTYGRVSIGQFWEEAKIAIQTTDRKPKRPLHLEHLYCPAGRLAIDLSTFSTHRLAIGSAVQCDNELVIDFVLERW